MKPFTWRHAILHSDLQSTTKLVLLALSCHINDAGESCYPSTRRQAEETGLSERAVITHLQIAKEAGWLAVKIHEFKGQKWRRHEYHPLIPDSIKALNDVQQHGTEPDSAPSPKRTERRSVASQKGTEPDDKKALNVVQSSSPVKKSKKKEKKQEPPALPAGLSLESWNDFRDHRRTLRSPMTPNAERRALALLAKLDGEGHDAEKLVDLAITNGWKSFYTREETRKQPLGVCHENRSGVGGQRLSAVDRVIAANHERLERLGEL